MFKHFAWLWLMMGVPWIPFAPLETANAGPVCPIEDQAHCQSAATGQFILSSDRLLGIRRADDFRPAGSNISHLCFFPCFIGVSGTGQGFECSAEGETPPDDYILKIYEDDFGIPGPLAAGIPVNGLALTIDAKANSDPGGGSRCWRYSAAVAPPMGITVTPNECYWLEVAGMGEVQAGGQCLVHSLSSEDGNGFSWVDNNNAFEGLRSEIQRNDIAFCMDNGLVGATNPGVSYDGGCGDFPVACCHANHTCTDTTLNSCIGPPQAPEYAFPFFYQTCAEIGPPLGCPHIPFDYCQEAAIPIECQNQQPNPNLGTCSVSSGSVQLHELCDLTLGTPPRHDCPSPTAQCLPPSSSLEAYRCQFPTDNRLATTDGPNTQGTECFPSGLSSFRYDIWRHYVAPCNGILTAHSCGEANTYDGMLQVFGDHSPTCTSCLIVDNAANLACNDDACANSGMGALRIPVSQGGCYVIRIGAWDPFGQGPAINLSALDLGVICCPSDVVLPPVDPAPPQDRRKNRYLSFAPSDASPMAFRIDKMTPPTGSCWAGPPDAFGHSRCQSAPHDQVWPETVHVGDCEIVPDAEYHVFVARGPLFPCNEDLIVNPVPLVVHTIAEPIMNLKKWGDVAGFNNGLEWTPPNLFTNVNDILAVLAYISNAAIKPTFQMVNLQAVSSADPCLNAFVNTADVLMVVKAAAGDAYPFTTDPANCPACP